MPKKKPAIPLKSKLTATFIVVAFSVLLDQFTKALALQHLRGKPGHSFLWDSIRLEYAENTGAFLSLGANLDPKMRTLLFVIGVFFIIGFCVLWLVRTAHNWVTVISLAFVISGGVGNLIDRVSRGSVVDFLYFGIGPLHTGVLNVADMAITGGLLVMLYEQYWLERKRGA
ncbi:MAG TPA: signal peptidase II [Bdellovibrionota bacterium]|jgi:signal peptidase II